ncbi:MAG: hypothetical protein IZT57_04840 [Chloroflexi bacterium]|nr:hypothetical protein [Chloroflexota bacterium]
MKKIIILLLFVSAAMYGQLDTIDLKISDFGVPSRPGEADFMLNEAYKMNQSLRSVDSLYTFIDPSDSSIVVEAITYSDTYWDDLRMPLSNTLLNPALTEPDFEDNGSGLFAWGFDADSDSTEVLNFIVQIPHSYKEGTDLHPHLHWQPETTNTGDVAWKVNYAFASIDSAFSATDSCWVVDAGDGVALGHQVIDLGDIDGTNLKISAIIMGNVSRVGDHALDTFTGIAYGLELDFHFEIDAPGSRTENTK